MLEVVVNVSGQSPIVAEAYLDRLVDANTLPWIERDVPVPGGTGKHAAKLLHADPATGAYALLARYPKGLVIPRHKHLAPAHSWLLQGAWRYEEDRLIAISGCYSYEELGAIHTMVIEEDTVAFHVIGGPLVFLAHDGRLGEMWDWESTELAWRQALADVGLAPTAWRPTP